ncbi:MAG: methyltransferase domain-containing protein [Cyclobacteriaceae bacterium]
MNRKEWFGEWFNSPYYHILYSHRDYEDAQLFIDNLIEKLAMPIESQVLDIACGKGRHSIYLNQKGFDVTGIDLSPENIKKARKSENDRLRFDVHDMREEYKDHSFDLGLNLFTSFGYFNTDEEHAQAIWAIANSIKASGYFLLDFLNPFVVINNLVHEEVKRVEGIEFLIKKSYDGEFILKDIHFNDSQTEYHYQEKVKAIRRTEFLNYFERAGLEVIELYGDYGLGGYMAETSERLIFLTRKC